MKERVDLSTDRIEGTPKLMLLRIGASSKKKYAHSHTIQGNTIKWLEHETDENLIGNDLSFWSIGNMLLEKSLPHGKILFWAKGIYTKAS